jgi:hypothetical protein
MAVILPILNHAEKLDKSLLCEIDKRITMPQLGNRAARKRPPRV